MNTSENSKDIPIYFYYLAIEKRKSENDDVAYNMQDIVLSFSNLLAFIYKKALTERNIKNEILEKVIWLDSFEDLKDGNYNLIFKSAKYNHVRNEIDTITMEELGPRKRPQDGDEEKTHLCIRLNKKQNRFLAVHESNHYGISITSITSYLNQQFEKYNEETDDKNHYKLTYEIMPGDEFLTELKKAKSISFLQLTVDRGELNNPFLKFANRADIAETVDIIIRRPKRSRNFPENLIREYYNDMQQDNKIRRIVAKGSRTGGSFEAATDLVKMKHSLKVKRVSITNEVDSADFFAHAQLFIDEAREVQ
ncbi:MULTISPECIES: hypothetical protein [Dehalobacter]|jgi:hypothetical protein|uniref:Uncharacterized protein n=2 Tax=Dehalobacter restrictus TaxID=55583 RepID=A0A857DFE8_9FIRM|nr:MULTISPECIES: hypothetical protein [Dehalobacter]AHF11223.1 hypothetical protein DEHRE_01880 [Dehalobacter restrictus DSM 9455]MCG1024990.1 hypothetical protein [Dehalobacter sp.]QGZ99532.1 hypothetical protein GQ588_02125 [Dehalobacter restrictus]